LSTKIKAPLRALLCEYRDLFIAASNGHVLAFDNVLGQLGLCGGGISVRFAGWQPAVASCRRSTPSAGTPDLGENDFEVPPDRGRVATAMAHAIIAMPRSSLCDPRLSHDAAGP
jgi:hypothetical protein